MRRTRELVTALTRVKGVRTAFNTPVLPRVPCCVLDRPVAPVLKALRSAGRFSAASISREHYPELGHALLVCATETKTTADIDAYAARARPTR